MCYGHPFCTCTVKPLPVSAVSPLQQLPHIISKAQKLILSPSHPWELYFPAYLLILHSVLQICVSRVNVTFSMPSLLLLTHSNSWNNISCAIVHFLQQQIFLTELCNPPLGITSCSTCACHFFTSSPDSPTHVNKACHLLSPASLHRGHSC